MIELKNVTKSYGEKIVYENFSCSFSGITALLGESGCGKTTLLNIVAGVTDYSGEVSGIKKVAYSFQTPRLLKNLTVLENLLFVGADEKKAKEMLKKVGVDFRLYPKQLSGGMADRVSLARAFSVDADTLLMDEPFRGLDIGLKAKIMRDFLRLYETEPKTVLLVTHSPFEAVTLASRAIVLGGGKIIADLEKEELTEKKLTEILIGGEIKSE